MNGRTPQVLQQNGHPLGATCLGKHCRNGKLPNHVKKGSYWWRDILKLLDTFKGIAKVDLKSGSSCFFWSDMWNDHIPSLTYPELFSFSKNKAITFQKAPSPRIRPSHFKK
jgi:hypothetical protein